MNVGGMLPEVTGQPQVGNQWQIAEESNGNVSGLFKEILALLSTASLNAASITKEEEKPEVKEYPLVLATCELPLALQQGVYLLADHQQSSYKTVAPVSQIPSNVVQEISKSLPVDIPLQRSDGKPLEIVPQRDHKPAILITQIVPTPVQKPDTASIITANPQQSNFKFANLQQEQNNLNGTLNNSSLENSFAHLISQWNSSGVLTNTKLFQQPKAKEQQSDRILLQLEPDQPGKLTVKLVYQDGKIDAHFFTANNHAKELLETSAGQLKTSLESHQIRLNELQVFLDSNASGWTGQGSAREKYMMDLLWNGGFAGKNSVPPDCVEETHSSEAKGAFAPEMIDGNIYAVNYLI